MRDIIRSIHHQPPVTRRNLSEEPTMYGEMVIHSGVSRDDLKGPLPPAPPRTIELHRPARGRRRQEILVFIFPLAFALVPVITLLVSRSENNPRFDLEEHLPPIICFLIIPLYHIYFLGFRKRGRTSLPFFGNIRVHWCLEQVNTGKIEALNTMRDFIKVTTFLAAQATVVASILVTFAYSAFSKCRQNSLSGCSPKTLYFVAQLVVLIVNFFFILINMTMATRFSITVSFMLNTKEIGGRKLRPEVAASVLTRANLYYGIGLRQLYYSIPLFGWLMGPYTLVVVTIIYLLFTYYVESVDSLMHRVRHVTSTGMMSDASQQDLEEARSMLSDDGIMLSPKGEGGGGGGDKGGKPSNSSSSGRGKAGGKGRSNNIAGGIEEEEEGILLRKMPTTSTSPKGGEGRK